jgi:hypothetical protein
MTSSKYVIFLSSALLLAQSGGAWAEGAIAVDDQPGQKPSDAGYGIGYGDSKETAEKAALAKCKGEGNDLCKVVVLFEKCGAYASSNEKFGVGLSDSEDDAKAKAMSQCGNGHCRVVASDCAD